MDQSTVDPCNVCGSTDVNLIDGYYYCVECGTQDVNVRETIIEDRPLADGTFLFRKSKRVHTVLEDKKEMSGEWYKWHAFNFILVGLADEVIALGAKPSFKMKLLWVWTKYVKKFQKKEDLGLSKVDDDDEDEEESSKKKSKRSKKPSPIAVIKKSLILSMLYAALNLDGSEIQLTDLFRFIQKGQLDIDNCEKYVPKEINKSLIPGWGVFHKSVHNIRQPLTYTMELFNCISVLPRTPNLRILAERYLKELCLPKDFKYLVFALMHLAPYIIDVDKSTAKTMRRIPPYEYATMTYILLALKMCFGLDDDYEIKLSDTVDKINNDQCYMKSHKLGFYSEPSERLFSFREWCKFLQLRKIVLSKYNLHIAEEYHHDVDDYVYMEHTHKETKKLNTKKQKIGDEIVMGLLDKIPQINQVRIIPKSEFKLTLAPLSSYTEIILEYVDDPDVRLVLSEDFSQYSMDYAWRKLSLQTQDDSENVIRGIEKSNKIVTDNITSLITEYRSSHDMVYVRNCENKHWLKTNQPTAQHINNVNNNTISDESRGHENDSNAASVSSNSEISKVDISDVIPKTDDMIEKKLEILTEEMNYVNIFDDDFLELKEETVVKEEIEEPVSETPEPLNCDSSLVKDSIYEQSDNYMESFFNPEIFDRNKVIRELVLAACKKYRAKIPDEYNQKEPKKRKAKPVNIKRQAKRRKLNDDKTTKKIKPKTVKEEINDLLASYYEHLGNDVIFQLSEQVRAIVNDANKTQEEQSIAQVSVDDTICIQNDDILNKSDKNLAPRQDDVTINEDQANDSVMCLDDDTEIENDQEDKVDPRFDEKDYDIKQLFVKIDDQSDSDDAFDIADDPDIAKIIDKKIEEIDKSQVPFALPERQCYYQKVEDFDDDIPLVVIKEEKLERLREKEILDSMKTIKLNPLVTNKELGNFKYWIRNYSSVLFSREEYNFRFQMELHKYFPKNFYFVLKECAGIVSCTPYQMYKCLVRLEERIML